MRPLIGVAAMRSGKVDGLRRTGYVASEKVVEAVYRAGGEPVILPPIARVRHDLSRYAGIVLPGGRDVTPRFYGQIAQAHPDHGPYDEVHDAVDLQIAADVVAAKIPALAICRGMQVLNIALGGTLLTELPHSSVNHANGFHPVALEPTCAVARAMGTASPSVSACHHQAVDALGRDLVVTGRALDGCIEAIEHRYAPILAVQWHPEDDASENPFEQALFDALVARARDAAPTPSMTGVAL
jgi:putative glutamine amidotransferase